jgi:hypothetical protein
MSLFEELTNPSGGSQIYDFPPYEINLPFCSQVPVPP